MTRATSLSLGVAMVALLVPPNAPAQNANIRPANINRSANLKSGIFRGSGNFIQRNSRASFIGGGQSNRIFFGVENAVIGGGFGNFVAGPFSVAGGGLRNFVTNNSRASSIGGGAFNVVDATDSVLVPAVEGGMAAATIAGGFSNTVRGRHAFVGGGSLNTAGGDGAVIGGGGFNNIETNTFNSVIAGGGDNFIRTGVSSSVIGGGVYNEIYASSAVIGGGGTNDAGGEGATVAGGGLNDAYGPLSAIGGGGNNSIAETGTNAVIGGGNRNTNSGANATIPGGTSNEAKGNNSFAAGTLAKAENNAAFVWGDGSTLTLSTNTNSFTVRATGGVRFITSIDANFNGTNDGVVLLPGAGAWSSLSDSNAKTAVVPIRPRAILAKLAALPVSAWQYKGRPGRSFIGPMAQDFHAAFGLGADDKTISTLDSDGVMYAAIQGLVEELKERDKEIAELKMKSSEVDALRSDLRALREQVEGRLPPVP